MEKSLEQKGYPNPESWKGWHSCLRSEWEAICVVQKPLINNYTETLLEYGTGLFYAEQENGGFQSNILENIKRDAAADYNIHCTVKPLALMKKLVEIFVPKIEGTIVLDPFAGSGTTLVAVQQAGVDFVGIEIEPSYIEIIEKRLKLEVLASNKQRGVVTDTDLNNMPIAENNSITEFIEQPETRSLFE